MLRAAAEVLVEGPPGTLSRDLLRGLLPKFSRKLECFSVFRPNMLARIVRETPTRAQPVNGRQSYRSRIISIRCTPTAHFLDIQTPLTASLPGQLEQESIAFVTFKRRREHTTTERDLRSI